MKTADFDFSLPQELIAQTPAAKRDHSRLLVVKKNSLAFKDCSFKQFIDYLKPADVVVLNDTKVLPARLFGRNSTNSQPVEILLLRPQAGSRWEVLVKPGKRARVGAEIIFSAELK
ncbi:MAG TPA: S-adenosylmethionine:tRNA ribosyltransferase-isomerase, partial [Firmicutes bacterium]|nr:S-adenosylmethionine:tRNA ribosyltransferase-isomerase [Bacillota bacterium]